MMKYDKLENKLVGISATLSAEMTTSITVAKQTVYAKIVIAEYEGVALKRLLSVFCALKNNARLTMFKMRAKTA